MSLVVSESFPVTHKEFIEKFLRVINKQGQLVDFKFNPIQELELAEASSMLRDTYVKPAQVGSTTLWMAVGLSECLTNLGRTVAIVSYDDDHAGRLLMKGQQLYDNIKHGDDEGNEFLWPTLDRENKKEMFFKQFYSTIITGSARSFNFGRGEPMHLFIGSEVAFWPDPLKIMTPVLDRAPDGSRVILESTPNGQEGIGKYFYKQYTDGKKEQSVFTPHFYPWWYLPEYYYPEGSPYCLPKDRGQLFDLKDDELALMEKHDLDEGHIRWRRKKQLEKKQAIESQQEELLFQQEFPEDDELCWLTTAEMFYDPADVERLQKECYIPPSHWKDKDGNEIPTYGGMMWYPPEVGKDYSVDIDPGMGKSSDTVIQVWENQLDEEGFEAPIHCYTISGKFLEGQTCDLAVNIANLYNHAIICPEANIPAVAAILVERRYDRIYMSEDIISGKRTQRPGWRTTSTSITYMFSEVARLLPRLTTHDARLVAQIPNVKRIDGVVKCVVNSDHFMTMAIFAATRRQARPSFKGVVGYTRGWPDKR